MHFYLYQNQIFTETSVPLTKCHTCSFISSETQTMEKDSNNSLKTIVLKINDKLGTVIVSKQTTLVGHSYFNLWLISLTLGITSFILLSLMPFSNGTAFSLLPQTSFWPNYQQNTVVMEKLAELEKAKLKAAERDRKLFLRHALERRKNVSKFVIF